MTQDTQERKDHFAHKAADYDEAVRRTRNIRNIGDQLIAQVPLEPYMHLMDFGAGTGLLLSQIAPHVQQITAVDVSPAMIAELTRKLDDDIPCAVSIVNKDLEQESLQAEFDGVISSMTLHHIRDVPGLFAKLKELIVPGGFVALADLDKEDGSFHSEDTGVHHHGFDRDELAATVRKAGFSDVSFNTASVVSRGAREYPIFLMTAKRAS